MPNFAIPQDELGAFIEETLNEVHKAVYRAQRDSGLQMIMKVKVSFNGIVYSEANAVVEEQTLTRTTTPGAPGQQVNVRTGTQVEKRPARTITTTESGTETEAQTGTNTVENNSAQGTARSGGDTSTTDNTYEPSGT